MLYGPDCLSSDEDGLSDDNDYYEFKQKIKASQRRAFQNIDSEAEQKKQQLKTIFSAVSYGKVDVVFGELDKGLDVDVDLEHGWTPLLVAATVAHPDIMSNLIERGANVNQSKDGTTPLMLVCNIGSTEETTEKNIVDCVKLLIDKKSDANAIDNKRRTAVMFAANNGHLEAVKLLLPLIDKEAEDNQRWNVLFYAVDGNEIDVVKFLLNENFNYEKKDIRGSTVTDLAQSNGFQDVLDLFPKDTADDFYVHLNNNQVNFEETFDNIANNEKPQFFTDICKILYGSRSESVMPILLDKKINLCEFLLLNDSKLKDIGIQFPFQRNRIIESLYKLHKHPFKPQSIPFVKRNQIYTNIDVSTAVLTSIKQLIAMEASLQFILNNSREKLDLQESKEVKMFICKCHQQINRLKMVTEHLVFKSEQWDLMLTPADKISKKRRNIPWCNLCLTVGVISFVILYKLR